jgi:arginase family enzyme
MLKELITPAKELPVVRKFSGDKEQLGTMIKNNDWNESALPDIVILGMNEERVSECSMYSESSDAIREQLYQLQGFSAPFKIVDLGNVKTGKEIADTYSAVSMVAEEIAAKGVSLLFLGGNQSFTVPLITGLNKNGAILTVVDDRIDNQLHDGGNCDDIFLNNLPPETIVNVMAVQSFFVPANGKETFSEELKGSLFTLGEIRNGIREMEPYLRETDLVSFDFGSIKMSEAPGQVRNSPNGLTGEEACQLAWYAGVATNPGWFSIFRYSPIKDPQESGAMMAAQIAWYFLHGKSKKLDEAPQDEAIDFMHFIVQIEGIPEPVTFLKHPISKRWWMEVPSPDCDLFPLRVPCSKNDYRKACKNEIPDRWWVSFNKTC